MHGPARMESLRCPGCSCLSLRMEARSSPLAHSWGPFGDRSSPGQCGDRGTEQAKAPCSPSPSLVSPRGSTPLLPHGNLQLTGLTKDRGFIPKHDLTWNGAESVWLGCPSSCPPAQPTQGGTPREKPSKPWALQGTGQHQRNAGVFSALASHKCKPEH